MLGSTFISTPEALSFFGVFSSSDNITRINVYDGSLHSDLIDNVSFGIASAPEPSSGLLLTVGLLAFARSLRRDPRVRR